MIWGSIPHDSTYDPLQNSRSHAPSYPQRTLVLKGLARYKA